MKYFDTFTGIGGFTIPLNEMGFECIGFSEIDKYAEKIYLSHFPNHKNNGDITKIESSSIPDFDILVGGFPCQSFSIAGNRGGFNDTRGTLFFDLARILQAKRPRFFVFENVKGLLSHDNGKTFKVIVSTLAELGYDVQWQVVNSKDFGVPQNRERVFIVGNLRGVTRPEVFPIRSNDRTTSFVQRQLCNTLTARYEGAQAVGSYVVESKLNETIVYDLKSIKSKTRRGAIKKDGNVGTLDQDCFQEIAIPVLTPDRAEKRQNGRRFKENGEPAFTLTAQDRHGVFDGVKIRRLTPLECERLQGFPDGWTDCVSDSQRYKCLGNAVTVNVTRFIFNNIFKYNI